MSWQGLLIVALCMLAGEAVAEPVELDGVGTTIVGDDNAAIGLYLMPWREEPMGDIDRPPRLLRETLSPVDADAFRLKAEWQQAVRDYRSYRLQRNR